VAVVEDINMTKSAQLDNRTNIWEKLHPDKKSETTSAHSFPVLIAEDNPVARRLLEKNLTKAGHEVVSAQNGKEAFDLFQKTFYPIVLTDWMMPEMDGVELCHAIRNHPSPGYVFIVFLTSKDTKEDIIVALNSGADDYLTKPFHQAELIARLKTGRRILDLERSLKEANEDIRLLSITDPLTGCFNRGHLMDRLPEEISRAKRYHHPFSLIMCDIDHFKSINDAFGHVVGDAVLVEFVSGLNKMIRHEIDWVARYGGEEFIIALSETNHSGAMVLAERLREQLEKQTMLVEGQKINITASFGISTFDPASSDEKTSPEDLIIIADKWLYQAKKGGRNGVRG
jgi:diguanylate cyclase (GGDEF)-like protein